MRFGITTFGCRLNKYDSQRIAEEFVRTGYELVDNPATADIWVINSCAVTTATERQVRNWVRRLKRLNPHIKLILTGCAARYESSVVKTDGIDYILPYITDIERELNLSHVPYISHFYGYTRAFVKIQEGCDQFCSYCIVPYLRGAPKSRPIDEIMKEIQQLIRTGYREIILTGTNIAKYKYDGFTLVDLLNKIIQLPELVRVGLGSIELCGITDEFVNLLRASSKFNHHLHIPLQSGDNRILQLMNRPYTIEEYEAILQVLRKNIPDICLGADVIVGFPGEDRTSFITTYRFIERSPLNYLHVFRFSPRPFIKANGLPNKVPPYEVKRRSDILHMLSARKFYTFRKQFEGKVLPVHIERPRDGYLTATSYNYIKMLISSTSVVAGDHRNVRVCYVHPNYTIGEVIDETYRSR